ncbi:MAG: DinB family protein [Nitrospinae bacterium]|nr:DinB family protein [Nitrospinota bacterium]
MEIKKVLNGLECSPALLRELVASVPAELLKEHRIAGKWCIHEHAVHLWKVQVMINGRLRRFMTEETPEFVPYFPGTSTPPDELLKLDLKESLKKFAAERKKFVGMLRQLAKKEWHKKAKHPEYDNYTPYIMARHLLLHDNVHMYRIEELWLTKELKKK